MSHLLVVDDEQSIRETFDIFLTNAGFGVDVAADYANAEAMIESGDYDLVISDIILGARNGLDLLRGAFERSPDTLFILITGQPSLETATESVRLGAYDYLAKPVTKDVLLGTVQKALKHRGLLLKNRELEQERQRHEEDLEARIQARTMELELANRRLREEIAERKKTEDELRKSQESFKHLSENVDDYFYIYDLAADQYTYFSPNIVRLFGHSLEDMYSHDWRHYIHADDVKVFNAATERMTADSPSVPELEFRVWHRQGHWVWVSTNEVGIFNDAGELIGFQGVARDITRRKKADELSRQVHAELERRVDERTKALRESSEILLREVEERRQVENALRISEMRYRAVFENSLDGISIYRFDPTSGASELVECNDSYVKLSGRSRAELFANAGDIWRWKRDWLKEGRGGDVTPHVELDAPCRGAFSWIRPDGRENCIEYQTVPLRMNQEQYFYGIDRDVTDERKAVESLRVNEEILRQTMENLRGCFFLRDVRDGRMIYVSPAFEDVFGKPLSEAYANPECFMDMVHPEDRNRMLEAGISQRRGEVVNEEFRILRSDGKICWIATRVFPIRDASGELYRVSGFSEDVTLRRMTEQTLRRREADLRAIMDVSSTFMMLYDLEDRILAVNEQARKVLGAPRNLDEAGTVGSYFPPTYNVKRRQRLETVRRTKRSLLVRERNDGVWRDIHTLPVLGASGEVERFAVYVEDVSRQVEQERRLRQAQRLELVSELAQGVAHDFNKVLSVVQTNAELALGVSDAPSMREYVERIRKAGIASSEMLLDFQSRSKESRSQRRQAMDLGALLRDGVDRFREALPGHCSLSLLVEDGPKYHIRACPTGTMRMLLTLCREAGLIARQQGVDLIDLTLREMGEDRAEFENAPRARDGYASCLQLRLCFSRLDDGAAPRDAWDVKQSFERLMPLLNEYESSSRLSCGEDGDLCVEIFLECVPEEGGEGEKPLGNLAGSQRALLVQGTWLSMEFDRSSLEELGFSVVTCHDAATARRLLHAEGEDWGLLVVDDNLPREGWRELLDDLPEPRTPPVLLFLSPSQNIPLELSVLRLRVLRKPFTRDELFAVLRGVLRLGELNQSFLERNQAGLES